MRGKKASRQKGRTWLELKLDSVHQVLVRKTKIMLIMLTTSIPSGGLVRTQTMR